MGALTDAMLWIEPSQAALAARVCELSGLRVVAAGSPRSSVRSEGRAGEDAGKVFQSAEPVHDLRHALATTSAKVVLLWTPFGEDGDRGPDQSSVLDDHAALSGAHARGLTLLALDPSPASLDAYGAGAEFWRHEPVRFMPLMRRSRAFVSAQEMLPAIGPLRTVFVAMRSAGGCGSLSARTFDAMSVIHTLLGEPESIDCSVVPPGIAGGLHHAPSESFRRLRGDLSANLRFSGAKAASLALSDRAGHWLRGVTLVGDNGCIRLTDRGMEVTGPDGSTIEGETQPADPLAAAHAGAARLEAPAPAVEEIIAQQVARALDPRAPAPEPVDTVAVLSMCEAALLSARTGQNESPATIMRMARVG